MWPFKMKEQAKPEKPKVVLTDRLKSSLEALAEWRRPGETFDYLGVTMCVAATSRLVISSGCEELGPYTCRKPCLEARYVDGAGVLQHITFEWSEAEAIMAADKKTYQQPVRGR